MGGALLGIVGGALMSIVGWALLVMMGGALIGIVGVAPLCRAIVDSNSRALCVEVLSPETRVLLILSLGIILLR